MKTLLVVDANPIISALIGGSSREIFFSKTYRFATAEYTVEEVRGFIPYIAEKSGVAEEEIEKALGLLPLKVYSREDYRDKITESERIIKGIDEKDLDILALALKLKAPIWTNDRHFENIREVRVVKTQDLI
ncbi:MAG: hypothetical protein D6778_09750 [Nitrospirae bacterium]|nr:MAG: hypothetical protein D6778_09750 [Nitrospirota bacterium]